MSFWNNVDEVVKKKTTAKINSPHNTDSSVANEIRVKTKPIKKSESLDESELNADVVLMTAVEAEYSAVRNIFKNVYSEHFENGFKYCLVNFKVSPQENISIAIFRQNSMGLVSASMTATYALNKFNPQLLLMCGVCAAVKGKANLGDLIVFSPVYDYGSGKYNSGHFLPDFKQRQLSGTIRPIVEQMCCDTDLKRMIRDSWEHTTGKPDTELSVHIYPGGSGAAVITDKIAVNELKKHQRTLGAIDMESYAVAEVASAGSRKEIPWLVVKGVQDFASPLKNDQYREYSAHVSGMFIKAFLERFFNSDRN